MKRYSIMLLISITAIILVLPASGSLYYNSSEIVKHSHTKKIDEVQTQGENSYAVINTISHENFYNEDFEENTVLALILSSMLLVLFNIVAVILSLYLFYPYMRKWMIQIYQFNLKIFLVHYLQLKDGKKNALSLCFS